MRSAQERELKRVRVESNRHERQMMRSAQERELKQRRLLCEVVEASDALRAGA